MTSLSVVLKTGWIGPEHLLIGAMVRWALGLVW